jgi:hypothetical protein
MDGRTGTAPVSGALPVLANLQSFAGKTGLKQTKQSQFVFPQTCPIFAPARLSPRTNRQFSMFAAGKFQCPI